MFTYHARRDEIKRMLGIWPAAMIPPWVLEYICGHVASLPHGSVVVELGTFVGGTTVFMARANPHAVIHTYDNNLFGTWSDDNSLLSHIRTRYGLPLLGTRDLLEIQRMHLEDHGNVTMHVADTMDMAQDGISLALVDDNRGESETLDLLRLLWTRLSAGGVILGDDIDAPHAYNAFARFAKEQDVELTIYSKCGKITKSAAVSSNRDVDFLDTMLIRSATEECHKV